MNIISEIIVYIFVSTGALFVGFMFIIMFSWSSRSLNRENHEQQIREYYDNILIGINASQIEIINAIRSLPQEDSSKDFLWEQYYVKQKQYDDLWEEKIYKMLYENQ